MPENELVKLKKPSPKEIHLTDREKQVIRAFLVEKNLKKVALELGISKAAVAFHCANIRLKFNETRTFAAVLKAMRSGLI